MNKRPISIFFWLKTGTLCWEADVNSGKLRNLFLIFKTPKLSSGALQLKLMHRAVSRRTICE